MLDVAAIRAHLDGSDAGAGPRRLGTEIRALGSVTSTSDIAWAWAEAGCGEGTVVLAEEQVRGRGRFGRTWHCPRDKGLLMSVVFRPPEGLVGAAHLTALGALAVAEAVQAMAGLLAAIRWPNDVVVRERKLAGVLVERRGRDGSSPCVMGVGLNVNTRPSEFPAGVGAAATSLAVEAGREFPVEHVAGAVLRQLDARYRDALEGRWAAVAEAWRERSSVRGQPVVVQSRGRRYRGRVVGLDPVDGIELELARGERRMFRAEWTTLAPAPQSQGERVP